MSVSPNYYDQGIKNNLLQIIWHNKRLRLLEKILPKEANCILDVGCHSGWLSTEIKSKFPKAEFFGIDTDQEAIAYGQKTRPKINFKVASAEKIPFPDQKFDLITCIEVLEHVENPGKALMEMSRCLSNNGRLVIIVPSENLLFRLVWFFWIKGKGRVWQGAHLHNLGNKYLDILLGKSGLIIEKKSRSHLGMLLALRAKKGENE